MKSRWLWLFVGMLSFSSFAADTPAPKWEWVAVSADTYYKDTKEECRAKASQVMQVYFAVVEKDGKVSKVAITQGNLPLPIDTTYFTDEEVRGVEVFHDSAGRLWFNRLNLSERLQTRLYFILGYFLCGIPDYIATASGTFDYVFDNALLGTEVLFSGTQTLSFSGINKKKVPYVGEMRLVQREKR